MSDNIISVARILELAVPRSWQEVVAVVRAAGDAHLADGRAVTAEDCFVSTIGTVQLTGGRNASSPLALAQLLGQLLEDVDAPTQLHALATGDNGNPPGPDELLRSLAYFERPGFEADITALATRALSIDAEARVSSELGRLRSSVRPDTSTAKPPPPAPAETSQPSKMRRLVQVGLVVCVVLAIAAGVYLWMQPAPRPAIAGIPAPGASQEPPATGVRSLVSAASDALNSAADAGLRAIGLRAPSPDGAPPAPPPTTGAGKRAPSRAAQPNANAPVAPTIVIPPAVEAAAEPPPVAEPPATEPPTSDFVLPPRDPFTAANPEVEPPVLVYPQLRTGPEAVATPPEAPYFEIVVSQTGAVETVRLHAAEPRMQDRMMVSAAKAWRFKPAERDGVPVRYMVYMPIPR